MQPHFLFNTLNTISALMHRDVEAADAMIARLSDLLRMSLQRVGVQEVTLKEELDFLSKYLEIEQTRFRDRLTVVFDIQADTLDALVPNLLLQPLVENAIKHGIGPRPTPGQIAVRARLNGAMLELDVQDNGVGLSAARLTDFNRGVGLSNTRSRLDHLYGSCTGLNSGSPPRADCSCASPFRWRSLQGDGRGRGRGGCGVTKIRTVVVDDEPVARERIIGLLNQEKDIEVVGEYSDGTQAVSAIQQQHPDLVFLDVQMPACDGFGVIQQLGAEQVPAVVFVTAYDEYALKAFEVHAIDYLLKPFGRDRFAQTLQHAREHLERRRAGDLGKRLMALVQDIKPEPQRLDRLVVKSGGRVFFLRTQEIDWIEAAGNYVRLHLGEESHLFRETMNNMEGRLDVQRFVRIHRSRIVNTDRIKEMQPWFNGEYVVVLQNGTRLTLSRGYREKLQERLGKGF